MNPVSPGPFCADGGTCHHKCDSGKCFRQDGCSPLSASVLTDDWKPVESSTAPDAKIEPVSCDDCGKENGPEITVGSEYAGWICPTCYKRLQADSATEAVTLPRPQLGIWVSYADHARYVRDVDDYMDQQDQRIRDLEAEIAKLRAEVTPPESTGEAQPEPTEPRFYKRKSEAPFLAIQWTGSNIEDVRNVYPGLGEKYMRDKGCCIGHYVYSPRQGAVRFMDAETFKDIYEPTLVTPPENSKPDVDLTSTAERRFCASVIAKDSDPKWVNQMMTLFLGALDERGTPYKISSKPEESKGLTENDWKRMAGIIIDTVDLTDEDYVNEKLVKQLKRYFDKRGVANV